MAAGASHRGCTGVRLSAIGTFVRKGYVTRRARNTTVGRALARPGVWRRLWGRWAVGETEIIVHVGMAPNSLAPR